MAKQKKPKRMGCLLPTLLFGIFILVGWFVETSLFDELVLPSDLPPEVQQEWLDQREADRAERRERSRASDTDRKARTEIEFQTKQIIRKMYVDARDIEILTSQSREDSSVYSTSATFIGVNGFGGPVAISVSLDWRYDIETETLELVRFIE